MKIKELVFLTLILLWVLLTRLWRLDFPKTQYFDEQYHVPAAQMMAEGDFRTPFEWWHQADWPIYFDWLHPPLAKYFQAGSIRLFAYFSPQVAWRLPSLLFSLASLLVFYFLSRAILTQYLSEVKLKSARKWRFLSNGRQQNLVLSLSLITTFFLSLDGLFLVQSRLAMNDIFYLFFSLVASLIFWYYRQRRSLLLLPCTGLALGFTIATKWTGIWLWLFFLGSELIYLLRKKLYPTLPFSIFCLIFLPLVVYLLSYLPYFLAGKTLLDFWQLQSQIWRFEWFNAASQLDQSAPISWLFNWRSVKYFSLSAEPGWRQDIYAQGNPVLFVYFWLALSGLIFLAGNKWQKKALNMQLFTPTFFWLLALFLSSFLPWSIVTRGMFFYHFLPALPWIILLTVSFFALFIEQKAQALRHIYYFHWLFWPFLAFIIFYPHWTALPVPESAALLLYFLPPNWR